MGLQCNQASDGVGLCHPIKQGPMSTFDLGLIGGLIGSTGIMGDAQTDQPQREKRWEGFHRWTPIEIFTISLHADRQSELGKYGT